MRTSMHKALLLAALAGLPLGAATAQDEGRERTKAPGVEARADELLHGMSDYLGGLPAFRVRTFVTDEVVTKDGRKLQYVASTQGAVKRPNQLRSEREQPDGKVSFLYDGRRFVVVHDDRFYATAPAPETLPAAIDVARAEYGLEAPAADLLVPDAYAALMEGVESGQYLGLESVEGDACHHLAFRGADVDWQIWIRDGEKPLPCRYVIVSRDVPQAPEFAVNLTDWETDVALPDTLFRFQPPQGAQEIPFAPKGVAPR